MCFNQNQIIGIRNTLFHPREIHSSLGWSICISCLSVCILCPSRLFLGKLPAISECKERKNIFDCVMLYYSCRDSLHLIAGAFQQALSSFPSASKFSLCGSSKPCMLLSHSPRLFDVVGGKPDVVAPAVGVLLVAVVLTALVAAFAVNRRRMRKFGFQ